MSLTTWLMGTAGNDHVVVDAIPRELWLSMEQAHVQPLHQALPQLAYEVARARRYERPLTIAVIRADGVSAEPTVNGHVHLPPLPDTETNSALVAQSWVSSALMTMLIATLLRESLREADIVTYSARFGICILALPETDDDGARATVARLQALCLQRLLTSVHGGVAEFSKAGWTIEELLRQAELDSTKP